MNPIFKRQFFLLATCVLSIVAGTVFGEPAITPKANDLWVMAGDSITAQRLHSNYIEAFYRTRYPNLHLRFRNSGIGGNRTGNVLARLDYDVAAWKPTIVSVELGMNDVNAGDDPLGYIKGMRELVQRIREIKAQPVLISSSPVNDGSLPGNWKSDRCRRIDPYTKALMKLVAEEGVVGVDQYHPLLKLWGQNFAKEAAATGQQAGSPAGGSAGKKPAATGLIPLHGNAVHPGPEGQYTMAATILTSLNVDREVSSATLKADGTVVVSKACKISGVSAKDGKLSFTRLDERGPWPIDPKAKAAIDLLPAIADLSRYTLTVLDLPAGQYDITIDGKPAATLSDKQLAGGWNMSLVFEGALAERSTKIIGLIGTLQGKLNNDWRAASKEKNLGKLAAAQKAIDECEHELQAACQPAPLRFALQRAKARDRKGRVLIVDGFSNHDWRQTTALIRGILAPSGLFEVAVSTAPATAKEAASTHWRPRFSDYDVVIQNCNSGGSSELSSLWPEAVRKDFEAFVRGGGGAYIFHSAENSFPGWTAYEQMVGLCWRKADFGPAIRVNEDGTLVRIPAGSGSGTGHGKRGDTLVTRLGDDPIHAGMPRAWLTPDMEVYYFARGPVDGVQVLAYARDTKPGQGWLWPVEWTVDFGKGRVYVSCYGHVWHDSVRPAGMRCAAVQTIIPRAVQWLAHRPVTIPVPADFPASDKVSVRPIAVSAGDKPVAAAVAEPSQKAPEITPASADDAKSFFNGEDLRGFWGELSLWHVEKGELVGKTEKGIRRNEFLKTTHSYGDFRMIVKMKLVPNGANSGIQFHSTQFHGNEMSGPQADAGAKYWGSLYGENFHNKTLCPNKAGEEASLNKEDWNLYEIVAVGTKVRTAMNGHLCVDVDLPDMPTTGMFGLQIHAGGPTEVRFKDFEVELNPKFELKTVKR